MNFCWITLNVKSMEDSLKFYHDIIGLEISEQFKVGDGVEISMLGKAKGTKVELIYNKNIPASSKVEGVSIGFEVSSLDSAMELLKNNNIPIKRGPISPVPSSRFFFVDDPNGIEVQLVENIK